MNLMLTGPLRPELLFCSITTAANFLDVTDKHILKLCRDGKLERIRIIDRAEVEIGVGILEDSLKAYRKQQAQRQLDMLAEAT